MRNAYARPYVLTQRTPVLRGGNKLSLLGAALLCSGFFRAAFLRSGFFRAAFLCSCHSVCFSFPLDFYPRTQDNVAYSLLCTRLNDIQHIVVYICFAHYCQLIFLTGGEIKSPTDSSTLKLALEACFRGPPFTRVRASSPSRFYTAPVHSARQSQTRGTQNRLWEPITR